MNKIKKITVMAAIAVCMATFAAPLFAQDAVEEGAAVEAPPSKTTFMDILMQGGMLMYPLGICFIATLGLGAYGFIVARDNKMLTPELIPTLDDSLRSLNIEQAKTTCASNPGLVTNILGAGLQRLDEESIAVDDIPNMEKAMEEASVEETASGLKTISYLSIIAQVSPMLGLLGTVSGMIKAFQKIGEGGMGKPEVLAGNIGEAMVTTATGLIIGIPAMVLYFYLKGKYNTNITRLGRVLGNLLHTLTVAIKK
jgi:biopolymer transport protein ExbB